MTFAPANMFMLGVLLAPEPAPPPDARKPSDDLARKLIRKSVDESATDDPMERMLEEMIEITRKLHDEFDPGEQTQALQRQVMERLDEAIKAAAARRRAKSQPDPRQVSDKRTMPAAARKTPPRPADTRPESQTAEVEKQSAPSGDNAADKPDGRGDLPNTRRAWGHLPQRDRDEVLQGADEQSLERYRTWIEQYFRALQESDK